MASLRHQAESMMTGLTFDATIHRYTLDGIVCPSVTGILQRSGLVDFSGLPAGVMDEARRRGTTVHQAIHFYNEGDLDYAQFQIDFPDYRGYLDGWLTFCAQRSYVSIVNECRVASRRHLVTGTLDTLGELDGGAVLLDYATGNPADVSKDYQTAAYLGLALEWAEEPDSDPRLAPFFAEHELVRRYAVALKKDGGFSLHPYTDPADFRKFLALAAADKIVRARRGELVAGEVV
jgi:hypothetical protein